MFELVVLLIQRNT